MKNEAWPIFSITDQLRPSGGWEVDHAILTTYSVDLAVVATALFALAGCDTDGRRTGSRVEFVRAIDALRGRVCVLAQANRIVAPRTARAHSVVKLLDGFVKVVEADERTHSWHPKIALVRYRNLREPIEFQWRFWLGSRNLTAATNWDAGLAFVSRADDRGQRIEGLPGIAEELVRRCGFSELRSDDMSAYFRGITWELPPGCQVQSLRLLGPGLASGFPAVLEDAEQVIVFSPFLDSRTVRTIAGWGKSGACRTLVSTPQTLNDVNRSGSVFDGFAKVCVLPPPGLPDEGAELSTEEDRAATEVSDGEDAPPAGLHAKLFYFAKGAQRRLWIGSANATSRAWSGGNFEIVAELQIGREAASALEKFAMNSEIFVPSGVASSEDEAERMIEDARAVLSAWSLRQRVRGTQSEITAAHPPLIDLEKFRLEVATFGGTWHSWPTGASSVTIEGGPDYQRSNFVQVRLSYSDKSLAWIQVALCDPPPDRDRDKVLISHYLDPRSFLLWLRSMLADDAVFAGGGDWDEEDRRSEDSSLHSRNGIDPSLLLTIEEILRAWARDQAAFAAVDDKIETYLAEIEKIAVSRGQTDEVQLLQAFRKTWSMLAQELR